MITAMFRVVYESQFQVNCREQYSKLVYIDGFLQQHIYISLHYLVGTADPNAKHNTPLVKVLEIRSQIVIYKVV